MPEPAFREHESGLMVPTELSRERQVWTTQEAALLNRVTKLIGSRGMIMMFRCTHERCQKAPIERQRAPGGDMILRCEHMDRVFTRAF